MCSKRPWTLWYSCSVSSSLVGHATTPVNKTKLNKLYTIIQQKVSACLAPNVKVTECGTKEGVVETFWWLCSAVDHSCYICLCFLSSRGKVNPRVTLSKRFICHRLYECGHVSNLENGTRTMWHWSYQFILQTAKPNISKNINLFPLYYPLFNLYSIQIIVGLLHM